MLDIIKKLNNDIRNHRFHSRTIISTDGTAYKQILINNRLTECGWDIEKHLEMVSDFGSVYNGILYEKIKDQVAEYISKMYRN